MWEISEGDAKFVHVMKLVTTVAHALHVRRCYLEGADFVVVTYHNPLT